MREIKLFGLFGLALFVTATTTVDTAAATAASEDIELKKGKGKVVNN